MNSSIIICSTDINTIICYHALQTTATSCSGKERDLPPCQIGVAIVSTAALTIAITAGLSTAIHFAVYKCINKIKAKQKGITPNSDKSDAVETDMYESV